MAAFLRAPRTCTSSAKRHNVLLYLRGREKKVLRGSVPSRFIAFVASEAPEKVQEIIHLFQAPIVGTARPARGWKTSTHVSKLVISPPGSVGKSPKVLVESKADRS